MQFAIIISLLLAANAAHGSRRGNFVPTNTCSPAHQAAVWDSVVGCQPRPTLIELEFPDSDVTGDGSVMHIMPGHAVIDRCSGSCHSPAHSCSPTSEENVTLDVMAVQTTYSPGAWNTLCTSITVKKHTSCACACNVRPNHCKSNQFYDAPACKCRCADQVARATCLASGMSWDSNACSCVCPPRTWRACSTGYIFDSQASCSCVRTYAVASASLATMVCVAVAMFLAIGGAVFYLKRRRELEDKRDEAQAEFVDAFVQR